ncbi:uncharacterized protein BJ212DRAFT_924212 [Suillus subaureus]|uniref:F-box domain-containing protein n=1 Tax=Suillus subaureus TaxID=48587 RepID=A0A9P7JGI7_9AGAM|nr:uncharacterized protein BJ212DRAFT_924212 [Suillus subaureus]KAG1821826.1 hypothetical protein BJ212DRAFT_924212 [Suillus subaureus]
MTAFGGLCHAFVIMVSLIHPDSPFQTPVSLVIQAVFRHFRASACFQHQNEDCTKSAMEWMLGVSRRRDVFRSVIELMPTMSELPKVDLVSLCTEVRDMFKACFDHRGIPIRYDSALAHGRTLIYCSSNYDDVKKMLHTTTRGWNLWERWRTLYLPQALEQCRTSYHRMDSTQDPDLKSSFQKGTCAALRMAVAAGVDDFAHPDDDTLIWNGQFQLESNLPGVDWLLDCAEHFYKLDNDDAAGDALLLFSAMQTKPLRLIQDRIVLFLNNDRSRRLRYIALRAARQSLSYTTADELLYYHHRHPFFHVVLKAICPTVPNECDQDNSRITNAINLLNFTEWPEDSDLATSPLPEIQLIVFLVLPAPSVGDLARYTHYCRALIRYMGRGQFYQLRRYAANIVCSARQDLVKFITAAGANEFLRDSVPSQLITELFTCGNDLFASNGQGRLTPYYRLAFTLAKNSDWHPYLIWNGYTIKKWITSTLTSNHLARRPRNLSVAIPPPLSPFIPPIPSRSPSRARTRTRTPSPARTPSHTPPRTRTPSPACTPSHTPLSPFIPPLHSRSPSPVRTPSHTRTPSPARTPSRTRTPSPYRAPSPSPPSPSRHHIPSLPYQYSSTNVTNEEAHSLFYLAGISLRIASQEQASSYFRAITPMHWWDLMRGAWYIIEHYSGDELNDIIESLPDLVRGTERYMPSDASKVELESLNALLAKNLDMLQQQQIPDESIISEVASLKNTVCKGLSVVASVPDGKELEKFRELNAKDDAPDFWSCEST